VTAHVAEVETEGLPLAEVAHRLRLPYHRAWNLLLVGELSAVRRRGRWYITPSSLAEYEQRQREKEVHP